jgi:TonB family protein
MYFNFEDARPDTPRLTEALSRREGVLLSIIFHLVAAIFLIVSPKGFPEDREAARARAEELAERLAREREQMRFVFVQPLVERIAPKPPERAEASDENRIAAAPDVAPKPANELPFSRGNTPERIVELPEPAPRGQGPEPEPTEGEQEAQNAPPPEPEPEAPVSQSALQLPPQFPPPGAGGRAQAPGGRLGEAFRNLERYVETFDNPTGGGGQFGPEIQFDTKGVEFGPWIRRFVAQVRRNWFVPYAVWSNRGHVVIQFNVHKSGMISDIAVVGPSAVEAFNTAALGAIAGSNPTQALPPAYPLDKAFFTVTFFYNESPE